MKLVDDSMRALSQTVLSEAETEAEQLLAEARQKADAIRRKAEEQAAAERKQSLKQAAAEAERLRSQTISTAQLSARTVSLRGREELLDSVFDKAHKQLATIQQWTEYPQVVRYLIREAIVHLRSDEAVISADATTQKYITQALLDEISKEVNVQVRLGKPLERALGVIAETPDGRRQYDNSFETRLKRTQNALRSPVYHLLMGESQ